MFPRIALPNDSVNRECGNQRERKNIGWVPRLKKSVPRADDLSYDLGGEEGCSGSDGSGLRELICDRPGERRAWPLSESKRSRLDSI